jgi:succinyldiaminopimelate transaminase
VARVGVSFTPPAYPYERLDGLKTLAATFDGGPIDCSIGTPVDQPPAFVIEELARGVGAKGYPPSAGTLDYRDAAAHWLNRRFDLAIAPDDLAACVGTKEFVGSLAGYLHLRQPERDTVLYPAVSYPTYAMGAKLAGLRSVPVDLVNGRLDLGSIDPSDVARALVLWANSPSNPTGSLDNLEALAAWARRQGVLVVSDECYAEFTWATRPRTILEHGAESVLALHSISKRSNLAGFRAGFYAGDGAIVAYLRSIRQHAGFMVPGPVQAAAALAFADDAHVDLQRDRYRYRLELLSGALKRLDADAPFPDGGFYLWCSKEGLDGWALATMLAERSGLVVSPGELYGDAGTNFVRLAVVQPDDRLELAASRLEAS